MAQMTHPAGTIAAACIASIMLGSCCGPPTSDFGRESFGTLELALSSEQTSIEFPRPLRMTLTVTNTGSDPVVARPPGARRDDVLFLAEDDPPFSVPRFRDFGIVTTDHPDDFLVLGPGESVSRPIELKWWNLHDALRAPGLDSKTAPVERRDPFWLLGFHNLTERVARVVVHRRTVDQGGVEVDGCFVSFEDHYEVKAFTGDAVSNELRFEVTLPAEASPAADGGSTSPATSASTG